MTLKWKYQKKQDKLARQRHEQQQAGVNQAVTGVPLGQAQIVLSVQVPDGMSAGQTLMVQAPNGSQVQAISTSTNCSVLLFALLLV